MKPTRRTFITGTTLAALSTTATSQEKSASSGALVLSPPVIQNPTPTSFTVVWRVGRLATGAVQWRQGDGEWTTVRPAHHGLVRAEDRTLAVRISGVAPGRPVTYRTVTTPLTYHNAYKLERGAPVTSAERSVALPDAGAKTFRMGMVNDTHENKETLAWLSGEIAANNPDYLLWNGDTCNDFYDPVRLGEICLDNGQSADDPAAGGWASTRPLLFVPGNHDVRGPHAHSLASALTPWMPGAHPVSGPSATAWFGGYYCFALRHGPVALIGLDTGEDKPDERDVFAGMAAYSPYRKAQAEWLKHILKHPEIASAPHLVAATHIPLRGLPGHNDGQGSTGYAYYSGEGARLWLPPLREAGCSLVLSGHTHAYRIDPATGSEPITQIVGGGPKTHQAAYVKITADAQTLRVAAVAHKGTALPSARFDARS